MGSRPSKQLAGFLTAILLVTACQPLSPPATAGTDNAALDVLAAESFLADIAQNVAGERLAIQALVPAGIDPHTFEPTPQDAVRIAESDVLIVNGAGFEEWLEEMLENAGGQRVVIEASAGLASRQPQEGEVRTQDNAESICAVPAEGQPPEDEACEPGISFDQEEHAHEGDPHFWLDPNHVIRYVENIRAGLVQVDPAGEKVYAQNAEAYIAELKKLDAWITEQVDSIPPEERLLVTNHESFGYYADRYGFTIIGTVIPSVSSGASPSAQQLASLIDAIRTSQVKAIFLETGANPDLAEQIALETGVKVVGDLFTHSLSLPGGPAPTYLEMMKYNTEQIVSSLK
jgi:ABC-type Zn uptake system ZnuABC Zn-binding protein ZnuA